MSDRAEQLSLCTLSSFMFPCLWFCPSFSLKYCFLISSNCLFNKSKISLGERILWCLKVEDLLTHFCSNAALISHVLERCQEVFHISVSCNFIFCRSSPRTFEQRFFWELYFLYSGYSASEHFFFFDHSIL